MIRWLCFLGVVICASSAAMAQVVPVRSGEHKGFTRLVMLLPAKAGWSIAETGRAVALTIDTGEVQFDTSQVFSRIPRTRLADLTQENPGDDLVFSLACACTISSFVEASGHLVIDIKDGRDDQIAKFKPRQTSPTAPTAQTRYRFPIGVEPVRETAPDRPVAQLPVVTSPAPITPVAKPSPLETARNASPQPADRPLGRLNISEERLLAQINRASDQGLLDLKHVPEASAPSETPAETSTEIAGHEGEHAGARPNGQLPVSVSVTTAVDRDLAQVAQSFDQGGAVSSCLKSKRVGLNDWGGTQPFDVEIGLWRTKLFGERDKVNLESALGLARAYLHFGFGAEARQAIDLSQSASKDARVLRAMAQILDADRSVGDTPFAGQQPCESDVALWAVLAANTVAQDVNSNAVQQAFLRLPLHLRGYLGPRLSQIFTDAHDSSMAKFILRAMARTDIEPGTGVELAKAAVAQLTGDTDTEEQELIKSLETGSEHSPEALVRLIENIYQSRDTVAPDLHELAAAYALEYRNTEKGAELRRTNAIALALAGQFDSAFETLPDIEKRDGLEGRQLATHPLLALLAERADDVTFSRLAMMSARQNARDIPPDTGNKIARRLLDLGFSELASLWVEAGENPLSQVRRIIRAEIALKRRLPNRAMVELLGLTGPDAAKLRAQALWQEGAYRQAGQMLVDAEQYDEAARGFWMAETWDDVPEQADARYAQIVAGSVGLQGTGEGLTTATPLAEARALMENSHSARSGIADLLQSASVEQDDLQ